MSGRFAVVDTGDLGLEFMPDTHDNAEQRSESHWAGTQSNAAEASQSIRTVQQHFGNGSGMASTESSQKGRDRENSAEPIGRQFQLSSSRQAQVAPTSKPVAADSQSERATSGLQTALSSNATVDKDAFVSADEGPAPDSSIRDGDAAVAAQEQRERRRRARRSREPSFSKTPLPTQPPEARAAAGEPNGPAISERRASMSRSRRTSSSAAAVSGLETVMGVSVKEDDPIPPSSTVATERVSSPVSPPLRVGITPRRSSSRLDAGSSSTSPTSQTPVSPILTSTANPRASLSRFAGLSLGFGSKQRRASAKSGDVGSSTSNSPQSTPPLERTPPLDPSNPLFPSVAGPSTTHQSAPRKAQPAAPFRRKDLQRYILSVGCVTFDLDHGPELEFLYPALGISTEERDNIAFSSFPDTSIFDDGFTVFSWRLREIPLAASRSDAPTIRTSSMDKELRDNEEPRSRLASQNGVASSGSSGSELLRKAVGEPRRSSPRRSGSDDSPNEKGKSKSVAERHGNFGRSTSESGIAATSAPRRGNSTSSDTASITPNSRSTSYIYGYVFFRQRRDASIRRGYFQKSVVILSHLPYVSLFSEAVAHLGPRFFEHGMTCLEAFCSDVARWPDPTPGTTLDLPFLGTVIRAALPENIQHAQMPPSPADTNGKHASSNPLHLLRSPQSEASSLPASLSEDKTALLASIPTSSLFHTFRDCLPDLWLLWECLLIAEPILVVAPDPARSSEAIWHAVDIVRPVPFAGDFRPFFHIHDYDFPSLVTKSQPRAGALLGVTNPFFPQACAHWPNILRIGKAAVKRRPASSNSVGTGGGNVAGGSGAGGGGPDHLPGLTSRRKRRISKDRPLLRRLADMCEKGDSDELANSLLRRYFASQTELFLAPLNRYVSTLIPADFDLSSPSESPRIHPFNTVAFLASLKAHGTPLLLRSRSLPTGHAQRQSLYVDFLQCPNFSLWLQARIAAAEQEQRRRRVAVLERGDVTTFARARGEIETVDLYSRLLDEIRLIDTRLSGPMELGPGSRWRTDDPTRAPDVDILGPASCASDSALGQTPTGTVPIHGSEAVLSTSTQQVQVQEHALIARRARLVDQLDRLALSLPEDLRSSLPRSRPTRERALLPRDS